MSKINPSLTNQRKNITEHKEFYIFDKLSMLMAYNGRISNNNFSEPFYLNLRVWLNNV